MLHCDKFTDSSKRSDSLCARICDSAFGIMEPALQYAVNRRQALISSMVGAALLTMPRPENSLRGSGTDQLAHAAADAAVEMVSEETMKKVAGEALNTLKEGQTMTSGVIFSVCQIVAGQICASVAAAMVNGLMEACCPKRKATKDEKTGSEGIAPRRLQIWKR